MYRFPENFIWATATAAHQVEGGNTNNDVWVMEQTPHSMFREKSGDACDHFNRYPEDIRMLAELGFNSYRFSIEWARVEPQPGVYSQDALEHYRRMLQCCHDNGLKPTVTLHHFTSPIWLLKDGGWQSAETPGRFADYAGRVARSLGDLISRICTINEANIGRVLTSSGVMPPLQKLQASKGWQEVSAVIGVNAETFLPFMFAVTDQAREIVMQAHHRAVAAIRRINPGIPCGITLAVEDIVAVDGGEQLAEQHRREVNEVYLADLKQDDFVGVQSYTRHRFNSRGPVGPEQGVELTQMGYEFWPESLEASIRTAHAMSGLPVLVTENGIATPDDNRRREFVYRALEGVARCIDDGIPVLGYTYWSAFDNFEWMLGYEPTFGLIAVDRSTQERTIKDSARWLGGIARSSIMYSRGDGGLTP
jgi:beta-glucosidase